MKMPILMNFLIRDQDILLGNGSQVTMLRIFPPNLVTLSDAEKHREVLKFSALLDSVRIPMQIFVMDKTENLSENQQFWETGENYPELRQALSHAISAMEEDHHAIQRAYYLVYTQKAGTSGDALERLKDAMAANRIRFETAGRAELYTVLRNFLLREFDSAPVLAIETEVRKQYEEETAKKRKRRRRRSGTAVHERTDETSDSASAEV